MKCVFSWDLSRVILKIRCPQGRLEEVAEKMHLKLKNREGAIKRFKVCKLVIALSSMFCRKKFPLTSSCGVQIQLHCTHLNQILEL